MLYFFQKEGGSPMGARPRATFEINPSHIRIQHLYWAISAAIFFKTGMNLVHFGMNFVLKRMNFVQRG